MNRSTRRASSTCRPRIKSTTWRAFVGEIRMNFAVAMASYASGAIFVVNYFTLVVRSADPPCVRKARVWANSPSLCPTIVSVT